MAILIALIIGAGSGWFICYAVDLPCSMARNIVVCTLGALVFGAVLPALFAISGFWVALIGSVIGVAVAYYIHARMVFSPNQVRHDG